ncbi:MAG: EamA family transporter [SAR202 cluster bacterium]|nr:EamA family transporter [SAR202 cluster bacterium]|tara:strand:- start:2548 stop:2997 length:450 start_codon:yes stop_codon:yes gene_type:complete
MNRIKNIGVIYAVISAFMYSLAAVIGKQLTEDIASPLVISSFSLLFGLLVTFVVMAPKAIKEIGQTPIKNWTTIVIAGLCSSCGVMFYFLSLSSAPVVVVTPIISIYPLITIVLAFLFLKGIETISLRTILGTILVISGIIFILFGNGN